MKSAYPFFALTLASALTLSAQSVTDPHITTWLTTRSGQYARVYETTSDKTSGNAVTTWPRSGLTNSGGGQATVAYADVQRVAYSANYVYIYTTGFASYTMGNWLNPNGAVFMFWPANRGAIHRIPRITTIPTTKVHANGVGGVWVNGVYLWENGDAQSYTTSTGQVSFNGAGIWNRIAGVAEAFNFDPANGHQPNSGAYHTHINPIGLRYQLGDNVTYNATTKTYSEASSPTRHSPILGWALDGLPVYGPYGYSTATDASSGIRRMRTGFQKRDGTNGSTNLASTGRTTLPVWAASVQGKSTTLAASEYGPAVNSTYPVGTFAEDYDYLGDLGKTQGVDFDLNRQNVRYCVTPEYPNGTYAYFVCLDSSGTTTFPDVINQEFYGSAAGGQGTVNSISEPVTDYQLGGPAATITLTATAAGSGATLSWNSAEGATYKVESSADNAAWTTLSSAVTSAGLTTTYSAAASANYYRVTLTAIATYDSNGTYGTPVGKTASVVFGTPTTAPSITTQPANVTVTAGAAASFSVVAAGTAPLTYQWKKAGNSISGATSASYSIAAAQTADAGSYTVVVSNSAGSVTSNAATLTVNPATTAPSISSQPASLTVTVGSSATFSVTATGTNPLTYQWQKGGVAIAGATSPSYTIASAQSTDAGTFTCVVTNSAGAVTSSAATLTVTAVATAPSISGQPASQTVTVGSSATFSVTASGTAPLTYQWRKGGVAIAGATSSSYTITNAQTGDAGTYTCVVTNSAGSVTSAGATLTVEAASSGGSSGGGSSSGGSSTGSGSTGGGGLAPNAAHLINMSVRTIVGGTAGTPVTGFVLNGSGAGKSMIIRAIGPTLTVFGVGGALSDPKLELWSNGVMVGSNDNWRTTDASAFTPVGAFPLSTGSADAAIVTTLASGVYSTPVIAANGGSGVILIECYDASDTDASVRLINASARAMVGTGEGVLIPAFVISGEGTMKLLVRAVGPQLATYGVPGVLADPQLTIYSGTTVAGSNDNWSSASNAAEVATVANQVNAFPLASGSKDAAVVVTLSAGSYSAVVSGVGGTTGTALVELYVVP